MQKRNICYLAIALLVLALIWRLYPDRPGNMGRGEVHLIAAGKDHPAVAPEIPVSADSLATSISTKTGEAHSIALDQIMEWIRNGQTLADGEREILFSYVSGARPVSLEEGEWQERVNEILNLLRAQPSGISELSDLLVRLVTNDPDPVIRMYALQHISMLISQEEAVGKRQEMLAVLADLASSLDNPLSGPALMFLDEISKKPGMSLIDSISGEQIDFNALSLVENNSARPDVRICALQTCAARNLRAAAKAARLIAVDSHVMIPLRKAAIHTLGVVGDHSDIALITGLSESDGILRQAAEPALERLQAR